MNNFRFVFLFWRSIALVLEIFVVFPIISLPAVPLMSETICLTFWLLIIFQHTFIIIAGSSEYFTYFFLTLCNRSQSSLQLLSGRTTSACPFTFTLRTTIQTAGTLWITFLRTHGPDLICEGCFRKALFLRTELWLTSRKKGWRDEKANKPKRDDSENFVGNTDKVETRQEDQRRPSQVTVALKTAEFAQGNCFISCCR